MSTSHAETQRAALERLEREWLDALPPAGHPIVHGIFQRLPDQLAALEAEPVPDEPEIAAHPVRAFATEAGDRLLARNADRDRATVEWLTNDIRAIEQEEFDKTRAALSDSQTRETDPDCADRIVRAVEATWEMATGDRRRRGWSERDISGEDYPGYDTATSPVEGLE